MWRRSSGFTLIESLIVFALVGLLATLFIWFLVPSMQFTAKGAARVDVQQLAVLCADRITRDLQQKSARGAVTLHDRAAADPASQPVVMAMVPYKDVNQRGRRVWEQELIVYYWDRSERTVYRREWPPAPPANLSVDPLPTSRASEFLPADLLDLAAPGVGGRQVARRVADFDARWLDSDAKAALVVEVSVEQEVAGKHAPERFEYQRVVALRN